MNDRQQRTPAPRPTAAIILAAGKSTRMKTDLPKVMHEIAGRPMLSYVIDACRAADIDSLTIVVGFGKDAIIESFSNQPGVKFVEQKEQCGTGHAVMMCSDGFKGFDGDCVVIAGDMPMIRAETLRDLLGGHRAVGAAASLATTFLPDPSSYGRIIRDAKGAFEKIVEHRDCSPDQLKINEVNPSYYCFDAKTLFDVLPRIKPNNAKNELYITDTLALIRADGKPVRAATIVPAEDATGINSRVDLADVERLMQRRIAARWMESGVTIVQPESTWIDSRAQIGHDAIIKPFSLIEGNARIGAGCVVGPYAFVGDGAVVADGACVGPGLLTAFDAAGKSRMAPPAANKKQVVIRRPPAQSGCA
jgi:bifunctional UDP-N-acetylglucosamine pyrophosphorylase/glucosamine-1-phosphate N-acetyltransferase